MNFQFSFASAVSLTLVHSVWQVALLGLLAALSLAQLRQASARLRHTVGMIWLFGMLLAPLATFMLAWHAPVAAVDSGAGPVGTTPWLAFDLMPQAGHGATPAPWVDWAIVCVAQLWMLGVAVMLALQLGGWRFLRRIDRQPCHDLPQEWQERAEALRAAMGIARTVVYRVAERVASPFTLYVLRPVIWLPLAIFERLPRAQVEALFAHELAHVRRLDWLWNGVQCLIEAVLFYHPGMWWLSRQIRQEREHACDDIAVAVCGDAIALAEALVQLQAQRRQIDVPRLALAAQGGSLLKRITHVLSGPPRKQNWWAPGALLLLLCSGGLVAMAVEPPQRLLTNLKTDASSTGPLTPGNYREFTATYLADKQRYYRISMDSQGKVEEVYKEDGVVKPVNDQVRGWLDGMSNMSAMSTTALPPLPALPATPATPATLAIPAMPAMPGMSRPPLPPLPPAPPQVSDSTEFKAMMSAIEADGRLVALTGLPLKAEEKSFHGSIHTWGARDFHIWGIDDPVGGSADFVVSFSGPKGRAKVAFKGKTVAGGTWKASKLDIAALAN